MPLGVAVFLIFGVLLYNVLFISKNGTSGTTGFGDFSFIPNAYSAQSIEPINDLAGNQSPQTVPSLVSPGYDGGGVNYIAQEEGAAFNSADGAVKDPGGVFVNSTSQSGVINYTVQASDTIPSIAQYFGVTVDTITNANPKIHSGAVTVGEVLKILPVSGVLYTTQTGDTLGSIASSFGVPVDQIVQANPAANLESVSQISFLQSGISLVIPGGKGNIITTLSLGK